MATMIGNLGQVVYSLVSRINLFDVSSCSLTAHALVCLSSLCSISLSLLSLSLPSLGVRRGRQRRADEMQSRVRLVCARQRSGVKAPGAPKWRQKPPEMTPSGQPPELCCPSGRCRQLCCGGYGRSYSCGLAVCVRRDGERAVGGGPA